MLLTVVKYCAIIICSFYIYLKLLHINLSKKLCISFVIFLSLILPEIYFLRKYIEPLSIFFMVMVFAFFVRNVLKTSLNLSVTVSAISFGISYLTFLIAAAVMYPLGYFIAFFIDKYPSDLLSLICIGLIQFLFTTIPFKIKRLKSGMPFLSECGSSDIGIYISILLLLAASFFGMSKKADLVNIIPVFFTLICGLALLFWWRNSLTENYIEKVKAKEMEELQKAILEKNKEIEQLKYNNNELSKIIHKDNKIIPAMEFAVSEYLLLTEREINNKVRIIQARELLEQLKCITQERSGILKNYEIKSKRLPSTNVLSLDSLLSYMNQKANEYQIGFDLSISGSVKYLIANIIDEIDIKTLLADLVENAIIATKNCKWKNILINIGISNNYYSIDIFDSGEPFTIETLLNLGLKRTTTHTTEGGSGIGLITAFEISKKYQASFVIEDFFDDTLFTKKVSIWFDKLGQYRIKTKRSSEMKQLLKRTDIILINDIETKQPPTMLRL